MVTIKSETSRASRPQPASLPRHRHGHGAGNLAYPRQGNWHLMADQDRGKLGAYPPFSFTGRVLS